MDKDVPTHYQTILMSSQMEELKNITGETSTLHALSAAVTYTLQNMKSKKEMKP